MIAKIDIVKRHDALISAQCLRLGLGIGLPINRQPVRLLLTVICVYKLLAIACDVEQA